MGDTIVKFWEIVNNGQQNFRLPLKKPHQSETFLFLVPKDD